MPAELLKKNKTLRKIKKNISYFTKTPLNHHTSFFLQFLWHYFLGRVFEPDTATRDISFQLKALLPLSFLRSAFALFRPNWYVPRVVTGSLILHMHHIIVANSGLCHVQHLSQINVIMQRKLFP